MLSMRGYYLKDKKYDITSTGMVCDAVSEEQDLIKVLQSVSRCSLKADTIVLQKEQINSAGRN